MSQLFWCLLCTSRPSLSSLPALSVQLNHINQLIIMEDQQVGLVMLLAATFIFIYYTVWTFVTPFLDDNSFIQNFFLPRYYAIALPVVALILGSVVIATFVGLVIIKSVQKKKNSVALPIQPHQDSSLSHRD